jgi:succinate-semialdehyde dehydrogenase/glutarate-semialdehyde dehydrogenase
LIDGEWRPASGGRTLAVEDPATEETIAEVADGSPADAAAALDAAASAQADWAATPPRTRGEVLLRAYEQVHARADEIASLISAEMGKSRRDAHAEVVYGAEFLRWFAEESVRIEGSFSRSPDGNGRIMTLKQPVGPALLITPWNFPLAMATRKVGPAIAAGCTMVLKPAGETPLTALLFASILEQAGLPAGVLNVVTTSRSADLVRVLLEADRLRKISFTGSTETGRVLTEQASGRLLRVSMELGGNAPFVVFEDADLERAVEQAMVAKLRNGGQSCTAANRFIVHERLARPFATSLAQAMDGLRLGPGSDPGADVAPLISARQRERVEGLVEDALDAGALALTRRDGAPPRGHYLRPTVLTGVAPDARVVREEIFGPVAPVQAFSSDEEALAMANDTEHGLVAFVFSRDLDRCLASAEALEAGMVGINRGLVSNAAAPFGGIKQSGLGREGGHAGLDEYLELKYVAV